MKELDDLLSGKKFEEGIRKAAKQSCRDQQRLSRRYKIFNVKGFIINFLLGRCRYYHICGSNCYSCKNGFNGDRGYCGTFKTKKNNGLYKLKK